MTARIDHVVTSGTFSLDGGTWDVDNNVWIVGDDAEVLVFDPAHSPEAVVDAVAGRSVKAIVLTHGHDDHIRAVAQTKEALGNPPVLLNPEDHVLWDMVYPDHKPDGPINNGDELIIGGVTLRALHTPGHSPGSTCFFASSGISVVGLPGLVGASAAVGTDVPVLLSGDTLFQGGPGATGRSYSSFETIIESIRSELFTLPAETVVLTGHGDATSIGAEEPHLQEWIERGH